MPATARKSRFLSAIDSLFGYDVFLSYGRRDGTAYATSLTSDLAERNVSVFLDREELSAGESLHASLRRSLRKSSTIVVIATPHAIESPHVAREIEEFAKKDRPIVVLRPDSASDLPWPAFRERELVWLDETTENVSRGAPSPQIVTEIERSLRSMRKRALASRVLLGTSALIFILALASLIGLYRVLNLTREARQRLADLNEATKNARKEEQRAIQATALAEQRRREVMVEALARHAATANERPELNLRIALEAVERGRGSSVFATAERSLRQAIVKMGGVRLLSDSSIDVDERAFSNNGRWIAVATSSAVLLFDSRKPDHLVRRLLLPSQLDRNVRDIVVSDTMEVAAAGQEFAARWHAGSRAPQTRPFTNHGNHVEFSADTRWFLSENYLFDLTTMSSDGIELQGAAWASNGTRLVARRGETLEVRPVADLRRHLRALPLAPPRPPPPPAEPPPEPSDAAPEDLTTLSAEEIVSPPVAGDSDSYQPRTWNVSPDGRWLIETWGYVGRHVRLRDLRGHNAFRTLPAGGNDIPMRVGITAEALHDPAFSSDSRYLLISGDGNVPLVYDLHARRRPWRLQADLITETSEYGKKRIVPMFSAGAFSPDGRWLATAADDIYLWALNSPNAFAKPYAILHGLPAPIHRLAFSPNGRWLISEAEGVETRVWDLDRSDPNVEPLVLLYQVDGCHFSDDSRWLISTDHSDGPLDYHQASVYRYWPLELDDMVDVASRFASKWFTREEWSRLFPGESYREARTSPASR